jgi:hypothetical protein
MIKWDNGPVDKLVILESIVLGIALCIGLLQLIF